MSSPHRCFMDRPISDRAGRRGRRPLHFICGCRSGPVGCGVLTAPLFQASLHRNWLEEHLDGEELAHLEKAQKAELCVDTLEREALVRTALAVGIRLALPQ